MYTVYSVRCQGFHITAGLMVNATKACDVKQHELKSLFSHKWGILRLQTWYSAYSSALKIKNVPMHSFFSDISSMLFTISIIYWKVRCQVECQRDLILIHSIIILTMSTVFYYDFWILVLKCRISMKNEKLSDCPWFGYFSHKSI